MKKILIISSNRLGDAILSSGINQYYKKLYKNSKITLACGEIPAEVFKNCQNIYRVFPLKKKKYSIHWFFLWVKVVLTFWDFVIDLRGTGISYFLLTKNRKIFTKKINDKKVHKIINYSNLIGKNILEPKISLKKSFYPSCKYLNKILKLKKKHSFFAVATSTNWIGKQWPASNFKELIIRLKKKKIFSNYIFVLLGSQEEISNNLDIASTFSKNEVLNFVGKLNLKDVFFIIKECNFFVGNDSGLMHLSSLTGTPTIGLFGPSDKKQYGPWGNKNKVISTVESPEELMGKKSFSHKNTDSLMLSLTVAHVEKEILEFCKNFKNA